MILDYSPGDSVEWLDYLRNGHWLPARVIKVTHESTDTVGDVYTTIEVVLYNHLKRVLCEPETKTCLRHKDSVWNKETRRWVRAPKPKAVWTHCRIEDDDPGDQDPAEPLNRIGLMEITL